jgi:PKD repeat protein
MLRTFRFILVILLYSIPAHALIEINSTPTTDPSTCDGTIEIAFTNETANHIWDVYITYFDDPSAAVITQSGLTGTMVHSFPNLCSGEYFIEVAPAGTECGFEYNATVPFNLDGEVFSAYFDFEFGSDYCEVFFQFNITGGNVTEYLWYFGDGAFSNVQEPSHIYTEPGCHTVILETTNSLGEYNEYEEIVCTPNCNVEVPELECEINGPFTATAGAQIMIQPTVSGGVLPYSYNWITPSGAYATPDELSGLGPHSITIDENANNGQNLIWFLEVEDSEGNTTQCEYTVIIAGGIPALDLVVFTDNQPLTPVTLFANIDFSNITHPINYIFNLDVDNGAVIPMGVQDEGQLNYSGGLPAGNYTATVVATDQMGTYQASTTFTIDGSVTPPPPAAPQVIIRDLATNASTPVTLEGGECVTIWFFILNDPFSGGTESPFPDCVDEYFIALRVFPEGGNEDDEYDIGGFQTDPGCPNNPFAFELCHSHFEFLFLQLSRACGYF